MPSLHANQGNSRRFLITVCISALALRVLLLFAFSTYTVVEDDTAHFGFGWEMGRVASSLASGHGFSSPLPDPTGPTAMVGPFYPLLLAAIFKMFGTYTTGSAIAARILQCLFASLTCLMVYLCARDTVGTRVAKVAAVVWALFPLNIFFTVWRVWETSLTGLFAATLFWCLLSARESVSPLRWAAIGALLGVAGLTNTSLVVLVVPFGLSALIKHRWRMVFPAVVGMLTCFALVAPWMVRNELQFGKFMLRSNFPLEFRIGNNELSYGQKIESLHPSNTPALNAHWQEVGELRFMDEDRVANAQFIREHRGRFVLSTINRVVNYWTGAWIRTIPSYPNSFPIILGTSMISLAGLIGLAQLLMRRSAAAPMFAGCLLIYPAVYYLTTTQPRFYHSITPFLVVLGTYGILQCWDRVFAKSFEREKNHETLTEARIATEVHPS
jgi:4-amino-4-deoxy-L-arabinose transferase-like glycosyltransferase